MSQCRRYQPSMSAQSVYEPRLRTAALSRQKGLTLIELMISMVLGLIVIAAVVNIYTGNSRSARFTAGLQTLQENGRYGVSVLQRSLRMAGYSLSGSIEGIDISNSSAVSIAVRSEQAYDCNGRETTPTDGIAVDIYRLDTAANQLTCQGNQGGAAMPIVDGVEQFRLLYGVDEFPNDDSDAPQRYIAYADTINPRQIVALRFALLVSSGTPIRTSNVDKSFVVLDTETSTNDRIVREVFSGTVKLRNRE